MGTITIDSEAYKEVVERLKRIEEYIIGVRSTSDDLETMWVDG